MKGPARVPEKSLLHGRALLASALAHGIGIGSALLLTAAGAVEARWNGAERATVVSTIEPDRCVEPCPDARSPADLPATVVEPAPPPPPLPQAVEPPQPMRTDLFARAEPPPCPPRPVDALEPCDWRTALRVAEPPPEALPPQQGVHAEPSPIPGHNAPPKYPFVAWRRGIEGTVVIELDIDATGAVTAARVEQSSGSALLDDAALQQLRTWVFSPARGPLGCEASRFRQEVVFRLLG
ncbi:MAG TPA: energy transducer TonB [Planctomycetota bacterium]|nr:energy transducer TonB [Planctomycetota bacterium]